MVPSYQLILISYSPVYRVSWLRAKARKERWEEELELVGREMEWTVRSFRHHEGMWRQRADKVESAGKKAYAWKQSSTWGEWATVANDTFGAL